MELEERIGKFIETSCRLVSCDHRSSNFPRRALINLEYDGLFADEFLEILDAILTYGYANDLISCINKLYGFINIKCKNSNEKDYEIDFKESISLWIFSDDNIISIRSNITKKMLKEAIFKNNKELALYLELRED